MIITGKIKPIFLLALGIVAISLVGSASEDTREHCFDNETCMMLHQSGMGDCPCNGTMTCCMIDENMSNKSRCMAETDQNTSQIQNKLNCTDYWLEKAIELHELHMEDPSTATNESQMELMDYMMQAHECFMGKNMTMAAMNCTAQCNASEGHGQMNNMYTAQSRLNCADSWLEKAIEIHEMHLEDPGTATDESQMEMMEQMMHAHECIIGKSAAMEMTDQERMDCASASLKMAMEMHELHMKDNCTATNESQMKIMKQMMEHMTQANEYMTGENTTMGMMNKTTMEMTVKERMDCASASLKKAMELHMLHMSEHRMEMNESQMEMMKQMMAHMMNAHECMTGENMPMEMNNSTWAQFSGEYKRGC